MEGGLFYLRILQCIYGSNFSDSGLSTTLLNSLQPELRSNLEFFETYLRIAPVFCYGGVNFLGWRAGYTAYGHGASRVKVGTYSGRLPGRAIAHNRQPAIKN